MVQLREVGSGLVSCLKNGQTGSNLQKGGACVAISKQQPSSDTNASSGKYEKDGSAVGTQLIGFALRTSQNTAA